ncbi:MAG: energy transducer TonB [Acidobacteriota bacterium]|nr:energy transducer TonB [Acidobacteriota bacterium]
MFSCLLKRVLPFTLTFMLGAFVGGLFKARSSGPVMWTWPDPHAAPLLGHEGPFGYGYGHSCRMRARNLVAETKPLLIGYTPHVFWPDRAGAGWETPARVRVTFGADGKVHDAESLDGWVNKSRGGWNAREEVERAARQIQFEPEMINGVPVSVTKEVEIYFWVE